ncbi:MAG: bacteriocin immunity protein [Lachnospiraceae bacterium]|nr:bacteriocin immunity protein [Lachnospiraceae bacterium]
MEQKLSREELVDLVETIMSVHDKKTGRLLSEEEHCALVVKFKKGINHPGGSDLIYYPELVGLPDEPTVDEIVDLAMKGVSPK